MAAGFASGQALPPKKKNFYGVNQAEYEDRPMHYGFFLGIQSTNYTIRHSEQFLNPKDTVVAISPQNTPAFSLGFLANYRFSRFFSVRALPTVTFYSRQIEYRYASGNSEIQTREATNVELPILLKYQSLRRDNVRMYLVAGFKGSIEANTKKKEAGADRLDINNVDLAVEYGAGFDLFYEYVKFSPEIRFSHGLLNLLVPGQQNAYARGLQRVYTHSVSLYLHFE